MAGGLGVSAINIRRRKSTPPPYETNCFGLHVSSKAAPGESDEYGERFTIDFETSRLNRRAAVRIAWIILRGESAPRLTSWI